MCFPVIQPHLFWVCFACNTFLVSEKYKGSEDEVLSSAGRRQGFKRCGNEDLHTSRGGVDALIKEEFPWGGELSGNSLCFNTTWHVWNGKWVKVCLCLTKLCVLLLPQGLSLAHPLP